jgi:monoamine oxidase
MPRTPLFSLLSRHLALARLAERTGRPVDELVDRLADRPLTRRGFLAASGAALAASAACRPSPGPTSPGVDEPVVVVGAGIAGLTAAWRLQQAGIPVQLLEAQSRIGGRMLSLRGRFPDDQVVELGGELIDSNHTAIHGLAEELGIELDDLAETDAGIATDVWYFGGARRSTAEVVDAFRPIADQIARDLETIGGDFDVTYRTPLGAASLDRMSMAEWLDRVGAAGWFRSLLDVGYTTEYGLEIAEQSALNLLLWIDPEPDPFRIYGDSDERYHVRGGNDRIVQALADRVQSSIELNTTLEAVGRGADGRLVASVVRGGTAREIRARHLVLTVPFTMLRDVGLDVDLSPAKRLAIDTMGYGTNAKLMIGFGSRPWRETHRSNGSIMADLPYQLVWETSRGQAGRSGILTNFTGGRQGLAVGEGEPAMQATRVVAELERVVPGVAAARADQPAVRFHWPTNPWVRASYTAFRPGQWTTINGAAGEAEGQIHFAGEHCSIEAQGFMEGGCETGERVADEVMAALGRGPVARRREHLARRRARADCTRREAFAASRWWA